MKIPPKNPENPHLLQELRKTAVAMASGSIRHTDAQIHHDALGICCVPRAAGISWTAGWIWWTVPWYHIGGLVEGRAIERAHIIFPSRPLIQDQIFKKQKRSLDSRPKLNRLLLRAFQTSSNDGENSLSKGPHFSICSRHPVVVSWTRLNRWACHHPWRQRNGFWWKYVSKTCVFSYVYILVGTYTAVWMEYTLDTHNISKCAYSCRDMMDEGGNFNSKGC